MSEIHDRIAGLSPIKRMLLEKLRTAGGRAPDADRTIPRRTDGAGPLSWEQRRLWFMHRLAPGGPAYTIPIAFRLTGPLDAGALTAAVRALADRHQALRLAFREVDGEPVQEAGPADRIALHHVDVGGDSVDADAAMAAFFARGFDLTREPPFRAMLARTADDEHVLAMALHHVASDGASTPVLMGELSALYAAATDGRDAHLPDPPLQLPDFAAWQRAREVDADAVAWWRNALGGAPHVLEVPADFHRPAAQSFAGSRVAFAIPAAVSRAVHARAAAENASLFSVLAAALAAVLHRATGETDLLIGTAVANRQAPGAEAAVGFFANTVPLRIRIDRETTARALIHRARAAVAGAQDHAQVPFDRIVEAADVRRDPSRPPLVQGMLSLDPAEEEALALPGIRAARISVDTGASPFDLTLLLVDAPDGFRGEIQYRTDLHEPATAQRLADRFAAVLRAFADDPATRIADLPLVAEEERRALAAWSTTGDVPADGCVHGLVSAQARATPNALAVAWADQEVSYAELDRRANRVAHHLVAQGIGAEARVGVLMERTPAMVAAFLGILKAGAAYVPLDPKNPPARLESMLRAAGATALLVDRAHAGHLASAGVREIAIESVPAAPGTLHDPRIRIHPDNLACVIFTSGSTGGPKGVEIRHGSVFALLHWLRGHLSPSERAAVLASSSVGFDVTLVEVFGALSWGGAVMLVDDVLSAPARPVRTACMVPSVAAELLRADRLPSGVRTLMLGGEPLSPLLAAELHTRLPGVRILNLYGPTECTVYATCEDVSPGAARVTIGRAAAGTRAYVLDDGMRPGGIGEPGELWLGGTGVARGYAGRPALTADRFRPDPHGTAGARMYRTLDRARVRNDGALEYRGRGDAQVKVHGVRIEPGEVEAALRAHPAVHEAAVAVHPAGDAKQLVAYVVPADADRPPAAAELRAFLRARLLEAMVPAAYVRVDALPRTTSGKLDRRRLPAPPAPDESARSIRGSTESADATEAAIAEAWRDVLGVERVGIHDDFFELGGHSLLALRLLARIRDTLRIDLPVAALLQGPTVAQMARAATGRTSRIRPPVVVLQGEGAARPLFLVHAGGGHLVCYHPLAQLLAPHQPLFGLQARGLDDGLPPLQGVDAMAEYYLAGMRRAQPEGPYRLGGWSYGGMVAWEMARRIRAEGGEVELLALIDTQPPEPRDAPGLALDHAAVLRRVLTDVFGWGGTASVTADVLRRMEPDAQLEFTARRLGPRILPPERVAEIAALTRVRMANHNATVDFQARPYAGRLTYLRSRGSAALGTADATVRYWGRMADGFGLHEVDGNHGTLLQHPNVGSLADALQRVMG
ncbi:MAG TPA: amino acid adenylation domain-containing protein [Longimicrobium sp.]|nr:amino acid adenylation domain-containing protein [Longimicrobium sp.]